MLNLKAELMDESAMRRALTRIAHEICEKNDGTDDLCLIGIRRRGVPLAIALAENIRAAEETQVPVGVLDITLYRDDLSSDTPLPTVNSTDICFDINGKTVVIVDDVIFTGRTVRAAIDAIFSLGRPRAIQLAVLIDRGHRQLPIRADYVGKNIPTSTQELVAVNIADIDDRTSVELYERR